MAIKNKEGYHKMPNGKMMKDSSMKYGIKETPKMEKKEDAMKMKMSKVMKEYKAGELNMGKSKNMVKSPKQAIAIGLSVSSIRKPQTSPKATPERAYQQSQKAKTMPAMKPMPAMKTKPNMKQMPAIKVKNLPYQVTSQKPSPKDAIYRVTSKKPSPIKL
jgi:hypothetical protein